jgi:endo-1,4-beta-xylanase
MGIRIKQNHGTMSVYIGAIILIAFFSIAAFYSLKHNETTVNLLATGDWSYFIGAEQTKDGIHINPIGRTIVHTDTSKPQENPPVNIRGPHLQISGDFRAQIDMADINGGATFQLYGQPPIIYDEWRRERKSIKIEVRSSGIVIKIWDGTSSSSIDERSYQLAVLNDVRIIVSHIGSSIVVQTNNQLLGTIPDHAIFDNHEVWFGADANLGTNGWTLKALHASNIGNGIIEKVLPPQLTKVPSSAGTLRNLATANSRHLPIGSTVAVSPLLTDPRYRELALSQFSMMTPENSMKPQFIHPQKNTFTFQDTDTLVEAAQNNQMLVHGHMLVSAKANPEWMQNTPMQERKQVMIDHINGVVGHYKGKVSEWDVVNEPLSQNDLEYTNGKLGLRSHIWYDAMGEDYIDTALRTARSADPSAKLYINDYGLEKNGMRWDALVSLLQRLQSRGVPIDGIGFESHVYQKLDSIDPAVLQQHIRILSGMGIVSRISEIDVLGDDQAVQAQQYADVLNVCLKEPTCTSYGMWGVTDLYGSTTVSDRFPIKLGNMLIWDAAYKAKPALINLQNVLMQ